MSKTKQTKVYISGPITGRDYKTVLLNFRFAAEAISNIGMKPVNPTTWWGRLHWIFEHLPYGLQMAICIWYLHRCQTIFFMAGWEQSRGACLEKAFADFWDIPLLINDKVNEREEHLSQLVQRVKELGKAVSRFGLVVGPNGELQHPDIT